MVQTCGAMDYNDRIDSISEEIDNLVHQRDDYVEEINEEIAALERQRNSLRREAEASDKWTEEGIRERLRWMILSRYGSIHPIKLVKLWMNEMHIDGQIVFRPVLLVLDKDADEINHGINPRDFSPSEQERDAFLATGGVIPSVVTLRFE